MKGGNEALRKTQGLYFLMLILLFHIAFCCLLFLISELCLHVFKNRIIKNGWDKTPEYASFEKSDSKSYTWFDYCLPMFIPGLNLLCTYDIVKMIFRRANK